MAQKKSAKKSPAAAKKKAPAVKAKGKSSSPRRKIAPAALSVDEKQRLLKPITGFAELVERLAAAWKEHGGKVKVPGLTPARLASLLRKAEAASKREDALRARLEARLQPLADARLKAEHEVWKSALDLHAMVKTAARTDPAIAGPFAFFGEVFGKRRGGKAQGNGEAAQGEGGG